MPEDVQHIVKKRQLYQSLTTSDRREAIIRARALASRTDMLFAKLREMAKKKNEALRVEMTLEIGEDELGLPRVRLQTDAHDTADDKEKAFVLVQEFVEARQSASRQQVATIPGKALSAAVAEFLADGVTKGKTFRTYRTALHQQAVPFFGADTAISSIDQERFAEFVKHVFADQTRAHSTKQGFVNAFTSMFSWLRARYPKHVAILTTKKLIPPSKGAEDEQRDAFSLDQIRVLFENANRYRTEKPHKFWVTVAMAFFGCRIEELAQVNLATDFKNDGDSGIWYFEFNEQPDPDGVQRKSIKKPASKRAAPIHSALIRHGFLDYISVQRAAGVSRLFERGWRPWRAPDKGGVHWAHYIIRWGGRELDKLNESGKLPKAGRKLTYFHSMRHTLAQVLAERGVSEEFRAALQGQAVSGGGENANRYVSLRRNPKFLSSLVEQHLVAYAAILDEAVSKVSGKD